MVHKLKIEKCYLDAKLAGDKPFEIRMNHDRGFQKGDIVEYREYFLNDVMIHRFEITYVCNYMQPLNQVVFGDKFIETVEE